MQFYIPLHVQNRENNIQRCALAKKNQGYSLKQHCQGVLSITLDLLGILGETPLTSLQTSQVLHHDIMETFTGDLPYTVKNLSDEVKDSWDFIEAEVIERVSELYPSLAFYTDRAIRDSLSPRQFAIFRIADTADLWLYTEEEIRLGNYTDGMSKIHDDALARMATAIKQLGSASEARKVCGYLASSGYVTLEYLLKRTDTDGKEVASLEIE